MTASREPSSSRTRPTSRRSGRRSGAPPVDSASPNQRTNPSNNTRARSSPRGVGTDNGYQSSARYPRPSPYRKGRRTSRAKANGHPPHESPPGSAPHPSSDRTGRRNSEAKANAYPLPALPLKPDCVPHLPFDLSEKPQHSFVSDASRVTSKLFDALVNNRVGVCDAHIHTKENLCVPISRSVLTALNSYLADYACPNTSSGANCSTATHVKSVPISSQQLRHILEFIYTNDCSFIRNLRSSVLWRKDNDVPPTAVVDVIQLAYAAHICHTPDLSTWCEKTALAIVRHRPTFLCSALNTVMNFPTTNADSLIDLWMSRVFEQPAHFLGSMQKESSPFEAHASTEELRCSVLELDANAFAMILKTCHGNDEYFFRAVYCWATRGYTEFSKAGPRWRNAIKLARRIDFTNVSTKFLLGFVDTSGLVDQESMFSIYRSHLAAKSNLPPSYGLQRVNENTRKRKSDTKDHIVNHETNTPQKKQRVDSGQATASNKLTHDASLGTTSVQTHQSRPPYPAPAQDEMLEDDADGNSLALPVSLTPVHQNQTSVTAIEAPHTREYSAPASFPQNSSLVHGEGGVDQNVVHGSEGQITHSETPQTSTHSNGASLLEQTPLASMPQLAKNDVVRDVSGADSQYEQMTACPASRVKPVSTKVKEEDVQRKVKEEYEIIGA